MSVSGSREFYDTMRDMFLEDMGLGGETDDTRDGPFTLGRYVLTEELGRGAFSRVYRGLHQDLMKPVAVKVFDGPLDERRRERLTREATTGAKLRHPGIIAIHDVGIDRDRHFIAMDILEGGTLATWLATEPALDDRVAMIESIARAVHFAHESGVLHRDLKPENVLMDGAGAAVVADFGLARCVDDVRMTRDGAQVGTPGYMAPEQVRGDLARIDARTDVHALGVMLYESLTGKLPFAGESTDEVYRRILEVPAPRPSRTGRVVPPELEAVCLRCLEKDPALRYASADDLASDLRRFLDGLPVEAVSPSPLRVLRRRLIRNRRALVKVAVIAALLVAAIVWAVDTDSRNERLGDALAIQSATSDVSQRLATLMEQALRNRYGGSPAERQRIVERVDALVAEADDPTGVGEAHRAWVRLVLKAEDAQAFVAATRSRFPDNPLVPLFAARAHVLRYADTAPMPQTWVPIDSTRTPVRYHVTDEPGTLGSDLLRAAARELEHARRSEVWPLLPALAWMVELMDGSLAYARGDNADAVARLEPLTGRGDAFEACLLVILAHTRMGEDEAALRTALELDRRHPDIHALESRVVECFRLRGTVAMARGEDPLPHFAEAQLRQRSISTDPEHDAILADLAFNVIEHRARVGEVPADDIAAVIAHFDRVLERAPDSRAALVGRGRSRARLARRAGAREEAFAAALDDLERAISLGGADPPSVFGRIETRLDLIRSAMKVRDVEEADFARLAEDVELFAGLVGGADVYHDYYVTMVDFLRNTNDRLRNRADIDRLRIVAERAAKLRERLPGTPEVEQLALAARLALAESDPECDPGSFELMVRDLTARIETSPLYARFTAGLDHWLSGQLGRWRDVADATTVDARVRARRLGLARAGEIFYEWALDRDLPPERVAAGLWLSAWVTRIHDAEAGAAHLERALDALEDLLDDRPDVAAIHAKLSSCRLALISSYDTTSARADAAHRGLRHAREACRLDADSADAWLACGRGLIATGRPEEAVDALETAVELAGTGSRIAGIAAILLAGLRPK